MTEKLVTNIFKTHNAQQFVESISEPANTIYYVFAGDHVSGNTVKIPNNSVQDVTIDVYNNMLFAKQLTSADVNVMAKRNNWVGETVYAEYSHTDGDLYDKNFFVVVDEGSYYHVYKCISNNNGAKSTVQPTFSDTSADDTYYETSDGYIWKYMYSVDQPTFEKFATAEYMPIVPNANVTANAVAGAIDLIKVISSGSRYDNYFAGVFSTGDLKVTSSAAYLSSYSSELLYSLGDFTSTSNIAGTVSISSGNSTITGTSTDFVNDLEVQQSVKIINASNTQQFEIRKITAIGNSTSLTIAGAVSNTFTGAKLQVTYPDRASPNNNFYDGCWLVITAGAGAGQYKKIIDYYNDGGKKIAVVESAFSQDLSANTQYEISPRVIITGDGLETINCDARALVNSASSNGVSKIEILNRGKCYNFATANIFVSNVVSNTVSANLKPIIAPPGGHGYDPNHELAGTKLGISVTFANNESNTITTNNDYSVIGILKDPQVANVELTIKKISIDASGSDGTFILDEKAHQFTTIRLGGKFTINTTSNTVSEVSPSNLSDLTESIAIGDHIIFNSGSNWQLANVVGVGNSSTMTINSVGFFTNANTVAYKATLTTNCVISTVESTFLYAANVEGFFVQNRKMIGAQSGAVANITNIEINNVTKNAGFTPLNQMTYYSGTFESLSTFDEDEVVYQEINGANTASARFHSVESRDGVTYVYVTRQVGAFDTNYNLIGESSGASFNLIAKYDGDLLKNSGEVIYIQQGEAVLRANNQSEIIKIIVEL